MIRASVLALLLLAAALPAMQVQDMTLYSPITGQPFDVLGVPAEQSGTEPGQAELGTDDDGCRHTNGPCEYDYYVATCPWTYFTALTAEFDAKTGRFQGEVPPELKKWTIDTFNKEWQIDYNQAYERSQRQARASGQAAPARKDFVMPQVVIPLEKRYHLALACYDKRGARPGAMAKVALMGAWALRVRLNVPVGDQQLDGGYQEVEDKVKRRTKVDEAFQLQRWLQVYGEVFAKDSLTNEGYLVCGMALVGMQVRDGDLAASRATLDKLTERFGDLDRGELFKGLVRSRKALLKEYLSFLATTSDRFILAMRDEEYVRRRVPEIMLVVAESLRRQGMHERAIDWYLALGKLPETQPALRAELREDGRVKALPADKPYHVQIGWIADEAVRRMIKSGVVHPGEISGPDKGLLNAILFEGLGTAEYRSPTWKARTGEGQNSTAMVLDHVGRALVEFAFRLGYWPKSLDELWEKEVVRDRNRFNRFRCPDSGEALVYKEPAADIARLDPNTVLIVTPKAIKTAQGDRYGVYCANARIVWAPQPPAIGSILKK